MLQRIFILSLFLSVASSTIICQITTKQLATPSPNVALLLAAQPDCPLRLDKARFAQSAGGADWGAEYLVHNAGSKPIRSFSTMIVTSFGTGGTLDHFDGEKSGMLLPGQTLNPRDAKASLSKPGSGKSSADNGAVRTIAVLMVGKIVFADGSTYDGERRYKELQDYFAEVDLKIRR